MRKRTVLITGITGGIGSYIAMLFAERGWNIVGQYCSSKEKAGALVRAMKKYDIPAEMHIFQNGGHGFGIRKNNIPADNWPVLFYDWLKAIEIIE